MLGVKLICVGKLKEAYWRDAAAEYEKRLRPFCRLEVVELPESRLPLKPGEAQIREALEREGEVILRQLAGRVFPLCIEGKPWDSQLLAQKLGDAMRSPGAVSFVIGSSFGLSPQVKGAGECFSMSSLTFPHQLARVMLYEQIYRGFQILHGTKYHK